MDDIVHRRIAEVEQMSGVNLAEFVKAREGAGWESIARDLAVVSRGAVTVSGRTIQNWMGR